MDGVPLPLCQKLARLLETLSRVTAAPSALERRNSLAGDAMK